MTTIYVSGLPPFDPATGTVIEAPIERQTGTADVQARTRPRETDDEGNRCDGAGCGNGRDEAGGAARAAARCIAERYRQIRRADIDRSREWCGRGALRPTARASALRPGRRNTRPRDRS